MADERDDTPIDLRLIQSLTAATLTYCVPVDRQVEAASLLSAIEAAAVAEASRQYSAGFSLGIALVQQLMDLKAETPPPPPAPTIEDYQLALAESLALMDTPPQTH